MIRKIIRRSYNYVKSFITGAFQHAEMTIVLSSAAIGMNAMIGELPFLYSLPMWIEAPFVVPFLAIGMVGLLVKSAEMRNLSRAAVR